MISLCLAVAGSSSIVKCADKACPVGFHFSEHYNLLIFIYLHGYVFTSADEFQQPIRNLVTLVVTMVTVNRPLNVT